MLVLFAPQAVPTSAHVPLLTATLRATQPALRQAAASTLRHLAGVPTAPGTASSASVCDVRAVHARISEASTASGRCLHAAPPGRCASGHLHVTRCPKASAACLDAGPVRVPGSPHLSARAPTDRHAASHPASAASGCCLHAASPGRCVSLGICM